MWNSLPSDVTSASVTVSVQEQAKDILVPPFLFWSHYLPSRIVVLAIFLTV